MNKRRVWALVLSIVMVLSVFAYVPVQNVEAAGVSVQYKSHVQTFGWESAWKRDGEASGTSGKAKRLEGIRITVSGDNLGVRYTTHCQTYGWLPWVSNGEMSGTQGEAKRLEAIKIELTGANAQNYDIYYRVHAQSYGWLAWAKNGQAAGTAGLAKRLEAIQIVVVARGTTVQNNVNGIVSRYGRNYVSLNGASDVNVGGRETTNITYRTHVQSYGWQGWKNNGVMAGTSGRAKRLEGIEIKLTNQQYTGNIVYRTHVQSYGWESRWRMNGEMSGTSGQAKRLEAIQIYLTGELANHYDVYYRVHAQSYGWLGWTRNGAAAGTAGYAKRLEAIQIVLVQKNGAAPGNVAGIVSTVGTGFVNRPEIALPENPVSNGSTGSTGTSGSTGSTGTNKNDVTRYSYEIVPLLEPFNEYFYVKTNNPDVSYVRFEDKNSKYKAGKGAYLIPTTRRFFDVKYENKETGRVKGGYIFEMFESGSDGGAYTLQQADRAYKVTYSGNVSYSTMPVYTDTPVQVSCKSVESLTDYLINNYTDKSKGLFDNLQSVNSALGRLSVYPKNIVDTSKPDPNRPYPLLATSPYPELSLNEHYSMWQSADEMMFLEYLHPMVLSSVGVPGVMANVAKALQPDCTVSSGSAHYLVDVTWNGTTKSYGGAGRGNTDPVMSKYIESLFTFDGGANDYAFSSSLDKLEKKIHQYEKQSTDELQTYRNQLSGDEFEKNIGAGSWLKVAAEGWGYGTAYTYVSAYTGVGNGVHHMEDVWVDGRYVNKNNCIDLKATYAQHPTSDILVRNKTFTNASGKTVTQDVLYEYDAQRGGWYAVKSYYGRNWWYSDSYDKLPADMKLSKEQVANMRVDSNAGKLPETGLIYDGTVAPGTPFFN